MWVATLYYFNLFWNMYMHVDNITSFLVAQKLTFRFLEEKF